MGVPYALTFESGTLPAVAGREALVPVAVRDAAGTLATDDSSRPVTVVVRDLTDAITEVTGYTLHGVAYVPVTLTRAGHYTLEATHPDLQKATGGSLEVNPGAPAALMLTSDLMGLSADGSSRATVTMCAVDGYGNLAAVPATDAANVPSVTATGTFLPDPAAAN